MIKTKKTAVVTAVELRNDFKNELDIKTNNDYEKRSQHINSAKENCCHLKRLCSCYTLDQDGGCQVIFLLFCSTIP